MVLIILKYKRKSNKKTSNTAGSTCDDHVPYIVKRVSYKSIRGVAKENAFIFK